MIQPLRVHIIPVGDEIVERIIKPAEIGRADKIYFIRFSGNDLFENTFLKARDALVDSLNKLEVIEKRCNYYEFPELMKIYAEIFREEQNVGNTIFVNVSTGGKLNSIAGTLACMLFGGFPYFCIKDFTTGKIASDPILNLPVYSVNKPEKELLQFLVDIKKRMGKSQTISKKECLVMLKNAGVPGFSASDRTSKFYNKLKFRYLDKLLARKYIKVGAGSRGEISITPEGKFALDTFSIYYELK
ncbi:MAG: DUF6293 family protein [Candidatus Hodarchaeota archaeon]